MPENRQGVLEAGYMVRGMSEQRRCDRKAFDCPCSVCP